MVDFIKLMKDIRSKYDDEIGTYDDEIDSYTEDFCDAVIEEGRKAGANIDYNYGATQLCFIEEDNFDYVIKMPFVNKGGISYDDDYEEDWCDTYNHDYTQECAEIYKKAVDAGVAMFFAEVEYVGDGMWKQEFVTARERTSSPRIEKISKGDIERAQILRYEYCCGNFDATWIVDCLFYYGQELFDKFMAFIDKENINDLHNGNYGWSKSGYPRLLDYSGYYE